jgi:hypothetical protein
MLVIGFKGEDNFVFSRTLDVDPDADSPLKIHKALSKELDKGVTTFNTIVCIDNDEVVAQFYEGEDYEVDDDSDEDDDTTEDDEDLDPDHLHDDDGDDFSSDGEDDD